MTAAGFDAQDERTLPIVVYVLYLLGPTNGLTGLIGLVIAYANRDRASPAMESHYTFQIRTFWISIAWVFIGLMLLFWGFPLMVVLIGFPLVIAGGLILSAVGVWFFLRCVLGLIFVARGEAYPRPRSWLV